MASLVADYGSDFTDSDEDYDSNQNCVDNIESEIQSNTDVIINDEAILNTMPPIVETVSESHTLVNRESVSSGPNCFDNDVNNESSESEDDVSPENEGQRESESVTARLPNPLVGIFTTEEDKNLTNKHSVFSSEYQHVEAAKRSVLEKHVKLTDDEIEKKRNRPICNKFIKGKCRFGARCKFSHDRTPNVPEVAAETSNLPPKVFPNQPKVLNSSSSIEYTPEPVDDDSYMGQLKRKRRYGVTDTLRPPKKAMNDLDRRRREDRPWTANSF